MVVVDQEVVAVVVELELRRAKLVRGAFLMKHERNERTKRIGWVSLVVDVAIMSTAISRDPMRVLSSSSRLARFAHSPLHPGNCRVAEAGHPLGELVQGPRAGSHRVVGVGDGGH